MKPAALLMNVQITAMKNAMMTPAMSGLQDAGLEDIPALILLTAETRYVMDTKLRIPVQRIASTVEALLLIIPLIKSEFMK